MFTDRTVIVVAAGASAELGLPIGAGLKDAIRNVLAIDRSYSTYFTDMIVRNAVVSLAHRMAQSSFEHNIMPTAYNLAQNMPLAPSIDNFLDSRKNDPVAVSLGKIAITRAILTAERSSHLFALTSNQYVLPIDDGKFKMAWHLSLWQHLVAGVGKEGVSSIFNNVSFIVFNYDRCLEHFLYLALQSYFSVSAGEAASIMKTANIIHPYGKVGGLPWEEDDKRVAFGADDGFNLLDISDEVRTFTESTNEGTVHSIRETLMYADTLLMLGFGYLEQNLQLLSCPSEISRAFMTVRGLSHTDSRIAIQKVGEMLDSRSAGSVDHEVGLGEFSVFTSQDCRELWSENRLRLAS